MTFRLLLLAGCLVAVPANAASIIVTVSGVDVGKGLVKVGLCDTALSLEGCPLTGEYPAVAETQQFVFENIPEGSYGFVGYQDTNSNSKFDTNMLGIPKEPYALSGPAAEKMIPSFADTLVKVGEADENRVAIELNTFGERKQKRSSRNVADQKN